MKTILSIITSVLFTTANGQEAATVKPPSNKNDFHIYLLLGQSNMAGRDAKNIPPPLNNPKILAMNEKDEWVIAKDPLHAQIGRTVPGVGPGTSFAVEMLKANPNITIGLVPCAVGGSPLKRWMKKNDLYEAAVKRALDAAKVGTIKGVLWHQGETDSDKKEFAETYAERLSGTFKNLRSDLHEENLPIVVGQLGEFLSVEKHPFVETVKAAIQSMPEKLSHVGFVSSTGLADQGDKLHFNAKSQKIFGERYAQAMQSLQK